MDSFQFALLIGAALTALISIRQPRALLWIATGATSFIVSTGYARLNLFYPEAITALCDASVCFLLYFVARARWERYLFLLFQGSVLVSTAYLAGIIGPHSAYIAALEGLNWLALLVIGGTSALSWVPRHGPSGRHHWARDYLLGADRALHTPVHAPFRRR